MEFLPTASMTNLRRRADLLRRLREFFHQQGFWEVETPLLSADTVIDRHLDPIAVPDPLATSRRRDYWLQTSPEFGMKRLLAAGASSIYQVTRAFRRDELGPLHNPEFTIVEWYRAGDDLAAGMNLLAALICALLDCPVVTRQSYRDAFEHHLALDPLRATTRQLQRAVEAHKIKIPDEFGVGNGTEEDRDSWLHLLMSEIVQPQLGIEGPLILHDYPASQAALAKIRDDAIPVAERFELFHRGIELANGYHELLDADVLEARQTQANLWRRHDGRPPLPEQNQLLKAMRFGLPPCCGVALGFDRLAMLHLGASRLEDVIAFPFSRA